MKLQTINVSMSGEIRHDASTAMAAIDMNDTSILLVTPVTAESRRTKPAGVLPCYAERNLEGTACSRFCC